MIISMQIITKTFACCERYLFNHTGENICQSIRFKTQSSDLSTTLDGKLPQFYCHLRELNRTNSNILQVRSSC